MIQTPNTGPYWLRRDDYRFPDPGRALREPNGLLAVGGDLHPARLLAAYRSGIFPWYSEGQPILWWSPDPRAVLFPERLKISRSLRKTLGRFAVTFDRAFADVVSRCAEPRRDGLGTWITPDMHLAYCRLHQLGYAHSIEAWRDDQLVGGLYGVAIGQVFFGESMFSRESNASKVAFVRLVEQLRAWNYGLIDCQVASTHLASLGAEEIPRPVFLERLQDLCARPGYEGRWTAPLPLERTP